MPKKERAAKAAAIALAKELDSEMTEEDRERIANKGMGIGGGLNKGEDKLFGAATRRAHVALLRYRPLRTAAAAPAGVFPPARASLPCAHSLACAVAVQRRRRSCPRRRGRRRRTGYGRSRRDARAPSRRFRDDPRRKILEVPQ